MPPLTRTRKVAQTTVATPASTISSKAVFQIAELLELILLNLSWKDLYTSQRVCRQFYMVIADSKLLRQKMTLFRPEPETPLSDDEPSRRVGPTMLQHSMVAGMVRDKFPDPFGLAERQRISPLLEPWAPYYNWRASNGPRPISAPFTFKIAAGHRWSMPGSWRQVYLTDPPVKEVKVRLLWRVKDAGFCSFYACVRDEDGITFGKLLDLVLEQSEKPWTFTGCTHQVGNAKKKILDVPGDTPAETIRRLERRLGGKAELHGEKSYVIFNCASP